MTTPRHILADQLAADMIKLKELQGQQEGFYRKEADEQIKALKQSIDVTRAIFEGLKKEGNNG